MRKILVYSLLLMGSFVLLSMSKPVNEMIIFSKKKFTRTIEKEYPISKNGEVAIFNKYGDIEMNTWKKDQVKIIVNVIVNATSEKVAEDVFETIQIDFEGDRNRVYAETSIESKNNYWWNWGKNLKSDFEINYTVYMPISCTVDFDNKYGNINMMDLENDARIDVKYGDLTMGDLEGDLELSLGYGNAYIGAVQDVSAEVKYSKLRCDYAINFTGETKYSGLTINNADKLLLESKYDNYNLGYIKDFTNEGKYDNFVIDKIDNLTIETKYSDVKVAQLNESLFAQLSYGGVKVNELSKGFDKIYIESDYAGVTIYPEQGSKFELEVDSKYLDIDIPELRKGDMEKDGSERSIRTSYNGGGKAKIQLQMDYGFLKIK